MGPDGESSRPSLARPMHDATRFMLICVSATRHTPSNNVAMPTACRSNASHARRRHSDNNSIRTTFPRRPPNIAAYNEACVERGRPSKT